jgi:hypothetical protein
VQSNGPAGLASLTAISANLHPPTPTKGSIGEATGFASVAWVQIEGTLRPRVEMQVLRTGHLLWEQGAGGSNPSAPTNKINSLAPCENIGRQFRGQIRVPPSPRHDAYGGLQIEVVSPTARVTCTRE